MRSLFLSCYNFFMNQRELFQLLGVSSDEDILRHFPSRYEDLHPTGVSSAPKEGERCVVKGMIHNLKSLTSRSTSIIRFHVMTVDGLNLNCILYNQPFYMMKLSKGNPLLLVLYYSESRKAYVVSSIYELDSYSVITGLKPVYTLPKGVSNSYFSNYIKKLLSAPREAPYIVSKLPERLVSKYRLLNEYDAYRAVHLPRNEQDLKEGLRVFKYEEALVYSIHSASLRKLAEKSKKQEAFSVSHQKINAFVKKLPYRLTRDQLLAIKDIVLDMEKEKVMYRLLQGDVGTGKTIVALTALYGNFLRGKQGVLMAPTFELALQHFRTAGVIFSDYPLHIAFLTGTGMKAEERRKVLSGLSDGSIDVLIATHSAISAQVQFQNLGLTIIDEQQRFGVEQREALLKKGSANDILMMSATPIPRTLSQIMNADLDVTTLSQFPSGIRNVETKVITSVDPILLSAIGKAIAASRQVFIVAPKIEEGSKPTSSAESVFKEMCERFGKEMVQILHGKIKKEYQEDIIKSFADGSKPILVSTTIIEVGIDVSGAGLLVVYDANCFGLSSLHQLRGRIGRSGDFALCLLVYDGSDPEAKDKLNFLAATNDGLKISQFDLKQRGSGSYSGADQSGKSELTVCNFVDDFAIFEAAKKDAEEILNHPDSDDVAYLKALNFDRKFFVV